MLNRRVRSSSLPKDVQTQRQIGERVVLSISVVFTDDVEIYTLILESRCIKNFPGLFQVGIQTRNCTVLGQGVVLLIERMHTLMSNIIMLLHHMKNVCSDIVKCIIIYFTVDFILSVCMCICMVE